MRKSGYPWRIRISVRQAPVASGFWRIRVTGGYRPISGSRGRHPDTGQHPDAHRYPDIGRYLDIGRHRPTLLGRPVWRACCPRPFRPRGKDAAAAASFPLGEREGLNHLGQMAEAFWETWSHLEFIYTDGHFKKGGERRRTTGTLTLRCVTTWPGVWTTLN